MTSPVDDDRVCPRCGTTATGSPYCGTCALDLAAQYALPTRAEWAQRQGEPAAPTATPSEPAPTLIKPRSSFAEPPPAPTVVGPRPSVGEPPPAGPAPTVEGPRPSTGEPPPAGPAPTVVGPRPSTGEPPPAGPAPTVVGPRPSFGESPPPAGPAPTVVGPRPSFAKEPPPAPERTAVGPRPSFATPPAAPPAWGPAQPPPPPGSWGAPTGPPVGGREIASSPSYVGEGLVILGAILMVAATLLPFASLGGEDITFWEVSKARDILLLALVVFTVLSALARLLAPRSVALAALVLSLGAACISYGLPDAIEIIAALRDFDETDVGNGTILALAAGVVLIAGLVLVSLWDLRGGVRPGRTSAATRVGLLLGALGGLGIPAVLSIHAAHGGPTGWEGAKVEDIIYTAVGAVAVLVALGALAAQGPPPLLVLSAALSAFLGYAFLSVGLEAAVRKQAGVPGYVSLLALGPVLLLAAALVAVGHPRRVAPD